MKKRYWILFIAILLILPLAHIENKKSLVTDAKITAVTSETHLKQIVRSIRTRLNSGFNNLPGMPEFAQDDRSAAKPDFTGTNNQISGVDEADIVKTDGFYIYQLTNNRLRVIRAFPLEDAGLVMEKTFEENANYYQMFLHDDYLVLLGNRWETYQPEEPEGDEKPDDGEPKADEPIGGRSMIWWGKSYQRIVVYDISDRTQVKKVKSLEVEGYGMAARKIDNKIVLVTNKGGYWGMYRGFAEGSTDGSADDINLSDILPSYRIDDEKAKLIEATSVRVIGIPNTTDMTTVTTLTLADGFDTEMEAIMAGAGTVTMTRENLYIAHQLWPQYNELTGTYDGSVVTEIYKLNITNGIKLLSSGKVEGYLINQFAIDEHDGKLRVATTTQKYKNNQEWELENHIYVLDSNMKEIGHLGKIASGETIYSVRFTQDRVYMVTFEQVDPFFVIDLSANQPKILGELKIPGFSNYLQPIEGNLVFGIGKDVKVESDGRLVTGAIKISLFDVKDELNPKEVKNLKIGSEYTYSEALYDHKGVLYVKSKNLLAFTVNDYNFTVSSDQKYNYINQAIFVTIDPNGDLVLKGKVQQIPNEKDSDYAIQRIVHIDNYVYLLSDKMFTVLDIDTLGIVKQINK
ncbi:MAG: beta-propeller domain-containing protein [Erysipelotrichaceae bacterium]|nr:beta-propeller domain-containing protein [Erysipelotrichaceae bacterium]MDP3304465.1 beta-propeller domain-containing protein [Erysipelotrichaceae bacterium]